MATSLREFALRIPPKSDVLFTKLAVRSFTTKHTLAREGQGRAIASGLGALGSGERRSLNRTCALRFDFGGRVIGAH